MKYSLFRPHECEYYKFIKRKEDEHPRLMVIEYNRVS
jgi:hypothetical protein